MDPSLEHEDLLDDCENRIDYNDPIDWGFEDQGLEYNLILDCYSIVLEQMKIRE
jgi:hypothetical protein